MSVVVSLLLPLPPPPLLLLRQHFICVETDRQRARTVDVEQIKWNERTYSASVSVC